MTRDRRGGALLVVVAAALWGTNGTARDLGPDAADPVAVGAMRIVLGGALLAGLEAVRARRDREPPPAAEVAERAAGRSSRTAWLVAAGSIAAYQPLFFAGVSRAGVAVGTVVGIGTSPIAGGLLARTVRGEPLGRRWVLATALGLGGAALLAIGGRDDRAGSSVAAGIALTAGAGLAYAVYVIATRSLLDHGTPDRVTAVVFGVAAVLLAPVALVAGIGWLGEPSGVAMAAWLAIPTVVVAYPLLARGLEVVGAAATATLTLAEPATAALLGLVVLDERLGLAGWVGLALVAAAVVVLATRRAPVP